MKQSNRMGQMIVKLCNKFNFDLGAEFGHMRLENSYLQPLIIEKHGKNTVAVMHIASDGMVDPMMRFEVMPWGELDWADPKTHRWFVTDSAMAFFGGRVKQVAKKTSADTWEFSPMWQPDAANFCNDWADNIKDQEWHKNATVKRMWTVGEEAVLIQPDGSTVNYFTPSADGFSLEQLRAFVGGTIEACYIPSEKYVMVDNEDHKSYDYEVNPVATRLSCIDRHGDWLGGPVLLTPNSLFR